MKTEMKKFYDLPEQTVIAETQLEMSIGWAKENPELFSEAWKEFFDKYASNYTITSKARRGFITLIATIN